MQNSEPSVVLLTRTGCHTCVVEFDRLTAVCADFGLTPTAIDVDEAAETAPDLRAEYGDRVPVVLLDGREHSYWEVDEARLRLDLTARQGADNV